MSFENDDAVVTELVQFTENEGDIYQNTTQRILANMATKKAQGKYDRDKAVQAFMWLAEVGARKYARTLGGDEKQWHATFPMNIRRAAATHWRDEFETEFAQGAYDDLLPKKYKKSTPVSKASTPPSGTVQEYVCTFIGRNLGAIGKFSKFKVKVLATDEDDARKQVYLTHESVVDFKAKPVGRRKIEPYHAHNVGDDVWWWGFSGAKVIGTVMRIHFGSGDPDYEVKIHGAGNIVMKAQHELASETGRKRLAAQTKAADRRKGRRR